MAELDPSQVEEVEVPQGVPLPFPAPWIEEVIHTAVPSVTKMRTPDGSLIVLLQLFTPAKVYTLKFDEESAKQLSEQLRPVPIEIARVVPR